MEYLLPLKVSAGTDVGELAQYLRGLLPVTDVLVVDGSEPAVFAGTAAVLDPRIRHLRPEVDCRNGKVAGVVTGFRHCTGDRVIVADDDVRYRPEQIAELDRLLDSADVVLPQNYFAGLSWHARWDTARTLLNRAFGSDYPGTIALRLGPALREHGYAGDVLFENLELIRTITAAGGRCRIARGCYVARLPPTARHFLNQRIRQAYDSLAQPPRLMAELSILPLLFGRRTRRFVPAVVGALIAAAEWGRRRDGGAGYFPATAAVWLPAWLLERGVCVWLALGWRLSGRGVGYGGRRLVVAAHSRRTLRRELARCGAHARPGAACGCRRRTG